MDRLKGKTAIITGGAMGIGRAVCELFAREGARVAVADIDCAQGESTAMAIRAAGGDAFFVELNVTDEKEWKRALRKVTKRFGKLNILVNNAGIVKFHNIFETSLDEWNRIMEINATGTFLGMKFALEIMRENGEPCSIINHSSVDGQVGDSAVSAYAASKGAVTLLTKCAALTCCQERINVRVNSVHPAVIRTTITQRQIEESDKEESEVLDFLSSLNPIGRIGNPIEIAFADVFLASDESSFVTGAEINVDGGWTAR